MATLGQQVRIVSNHAGCCMYYYVCKSPDERAPWLCTWRHFLDLGSGPGRSARVPSLISQRPWRQASCIRWEQSNAMTTSNENIDSRTAVNWPVMWPLIWRSCGDGVSIQPTAWLPRPHDGTTVGRAKSAAFGLLGTTLCRETTRRSGRVRGRQTGRQADRQTENRVWFRVWRWHILQKTILTWQCQMRSIIWYL